MGKKSLRASIALLVIFIFLISFLAESSNATYPLKKSSLLIPLPRTSYSPGEVLVKFKKEASQKSKAETKEAADVEKTLKSYKLKNKQTMELLKLDENVPVYEAVEELEEQKAVEFAEPNYLVKASYAPNDTSFANQWGFNNTGQTIQGSAGTTDADIDAVEAWDIERGTSNTITVAVIDSGIDTTHPDLISNLWQNSDETAGNGVDDNGNGYIDDVNGYNWTGISQYYANAFETIADTSSYAVAQSIKGTGQTLSAIGISLSKAGSPSSTLTVSVRSSLSGANLASISSTNPYATFFKQPFAFFLL